MTPLIARNLHIISTEVSNRLVHADDLQEDPETNACTLTDGKTCHIMICDYYSTRLWEDVPQYSVGEYLLDKRIMDNTGSMGNG